MSSYLTKEEVIEFQKIFKTVNGVDLDFAQSEDQATRLVMLFEAMGSSSQVPLSEKDIVAINRKEI